MHAAALRVDLRIPLVNSLKEKRGVLRALQSGLRKFEVAVAEVDFQDQHRRAAVGIAAVSGEAFHLQRVLLEVERWLRSRPEVEVLAVEIGHLVPE